MDELRYVIEEDGTISITTDAISAANHYAADELLSEIESLCGGVRRTDKRKEKHVHVMNGRVVCHSH